MGQAPWWALLGFVAFWAASAWLAFELFRASFDIRVAKGSVATLLFGIPITTIAWNDIVKIVRHTSLSGEGVYESIIVLYGVRRKIKISEGLLDHGGLVQLLNDYARNKKIPLYERGNGIGAQEIISFLTGRGVRILPIDHWTVEVDRLVESGPRPPSYGFVKSGSWACNILGSTSLDCAPLSRESRRLESEGHVSIWFLRRANGNDEL
jgi:hypothetical protein